MTSFERDATTELMNQPLTGAPPRSVVLVVNRQSGRFLQCKERLDAALARERLQVVEELDVHNLERLRHWTAGDAADRPMVVAVGGDGTVGSVAGWVANTGITLGILPLGTNNDTARSLDIPRRIDEAVHLLVTGRVSTVDAARFVPETGEPRYFVQAAAMGIQVAFSRLATNVSVRRRFRRFTYLAATALALHDRQPFACQLLTDGRAHEHSLLYLTVLNAPIFGGPLRLRFAGASIDNRQLEVLTIEDMSLARLLFAMVPLLFGRTPRSAGIHVYNVSRLGVVTQNPLDVTLDGEIVSCAPGEFVLAPEALHVVTPQTFQDVDD